MSRTYKDRPSSIRFPSEENSKKKKRIDSVWHWMSTPSWWTRMMMNRPQRMKGRHWENRIVKEDVAEIDLIVSPDVNRKPHQYYW